jgi:hypothetical protein
MAERLKILPGTGRGTMRSMVEGAHIGGLAKPGARSSLCAGGPPPPRRFASRSPSPFRGGFAAASEAAEERLSYSHRPVQGGSMFCTPGFASLFDDTAGVWKKHAVSANFGNIRGERS